MNTNLTHLEERYEAKVKRSKNGGGFDEYEALYRQTNTTCSGEWSQIEISQPGVPSSNYRPIADISEDGTSFFIKYDEKYLASQLAESDGTHNFQSSLKKKNPTDPDSYCVSVFMFVWGILRKYYCLLFLSPTSFYCVFIAHYYSRLVLKSLNLGIKT